MIEIGMRLPEARLLRIGVDGPEEVRLSELLKGRKVVIFAVPGAFTPTCDSAHVPSFIRTVEDYRAKGVEEIICVSVNDAHVMRYWGETTGATAAGITMLADADGSFAWALGMIYDNPAAGMFRRSRPLCDGGRGWLRDGLRTGPDRPVQPFDGRGASGKALNATCGRGSGRGIRPVRRDRAAPRPGPRSCPSAWPA